MHRNEHAVLELLDSERLFEPDHRNQPTDLSVPEATPPILQTLPSPWKFIVRRAAATARLDDDYRLPDPSPPHGDGTCPLFSFLHHTGFRPFLDTVTITVLDVLGFRKW